MSIVSEFLYRGVFVVFAVGLLVPLELATGIGKQSWQSRVRGVLFLTIWLVVSVLTVIVLQAFWAAVGFRPPHLINVPMPAGPILAAVLAVIIGDFWFYWYHRMQHRFLWRFHRVHHSIREMSAANVYHHVSETFFNSLFLLIPATLFSSAPEITVPVVLLIVSVQSHYIHSTLGVHFGPLRQILCDNRFHRIHHSLDPGHFGSNFGVSLTIWDRLFGTAYWPANDEWPEIGVEGVPEPRTVKDWLLLPFRRVAE